MRDKASLEKERELEKEKEKQDRYNRRRARDAAARAAGEERRDPSQERMPAAADGSDGVQESEEADVSVAPTPGLPPDTVPRIDVSIGVYVCQLLR